MQKPRLGFWQIWNMSFGFFGIQIGFALQNANVSRIFQTLGASIDELPILWLAGPVTGLLIQPLIGHFSDKTWGRFGRRRPYFLAGAILATLALLVMPNSPTLWIAAGTLWILDASLNITMEPFRAFVGDMLPNEQRTRGFAMQGVFIGAGALLASFAPFVLTEWMGAANDASAGAVPQSVHIAFYAGAAALFLAVMWTIATTQEYSPDQLSGFTDTETIFTSERAGRDAAGPGFFLRWGFLALLAGAAILGVVYNYKADKQLYVLGGGVAALGLAFLLNARLVAAGRTKGFFSQILNDLATMPRVMRRLAVVQFFSWVALFLMWIYATPTVAARQFGAASPGTPEFEAGANWVGVLFGVYNGVAMLYSFVTPALSRALGQRAVHGISLLAGAAGLGSFFFLDSPNALLLSMVGVGIAWASILTMPYAMLSSALPAQKMGVYMGIFNFFIVLPQIMVAGVTGPIVRAFFNGDAAYAFLVAGGAFALAALATAFVKAK